jgi:hypothetical protein
MVVARISLFRGAKTFHASGSGFHRDPIPVGVLMPVSLWRFASPIFWNFFPEIGSARILDDAR